MLIRKIQPFEGALYRLGLLMLCFDFYRH